MSEEDGTCGILKPKSELPVHSFHLKCCTFYCALLLLLLLLLLKLYMKYNIRQIKTIKVKEIG